MPVFNIFVSSLNQLSAHFLANVAFKQNIQDKVYKWTRSAANSINMCVIIKCERIFFCMSSCFGDNILFMISEANLLPQPQCSVVSLEDQKRFWKNGKSLLS